MGPQKGYPNLLKTGAVQANLCAALMFFRTQEMPCPPAVQLSWKQIQGHYCISCKRTSTTSQDLQGCVESCTEFREILVYLISLYTKHPVLSPSAPAASHTSQSLALKMFGRRGQPFHMLPTTLLLAADPSAGQGGIFLSPIWECTWIPALCCLQQHVSIAKRKVFV